MKKKTTFVYKKSLKLPAAIGDWTKLKKEELGEKEAIEKYFPKLAARQIERLHFLHYELAENIRQRFEALFQSPVLLHSIVVEQLKYGSFLKRAGSALVQANFKTGPDEIIFCLEPALAEALVDAALGGGGKDLNQSLELTEIERAVLNEILAEFLDVFRDLWKTALKSEAVLMPIITDGPKNFAFSEDSFLLSTTIKLAFSEGTQGQIFLGYSDEILKSLLGFLSQAGDGEKPKKVTLEPRTLAGILVPIRAELGTTALTTGELAKIRIGDVVSLDKKAGSPVYVIVAEQIQLKGDLGVYEGRLSLKVQKEKGVKLAGQADPGLIAEKLKEKEAREEMARQEFNEFEIEKKVEDEYDLGGAKLEEVEEDIEEIYKEKKEPQTEEDEIEDYGFSLDEEQTEK